MTTKQIEADIADSLSDAVRGMDEACGIAKSEWGDNDPRTKELESVWTDVYGIFKRYHKHTPSAVKYFTVHNPKTGIWFDVCTSENIDMVRDREPDAFFKRTTKAKYNELYESMRAPVRRFKYYAIIGKASDLVIGACTDCGMGDVLREEPGSSFVRIPKKLYIKYTNGDESAGKEMIAEWRRKVGI